MNCENVRTLLGPYQDGEVTDLLTVEAIERHLATCEDCRREMATIREMSREIRSKATYFVAPDGLEARIRERIDLPTFENALKLPKRSFWKVATPMLVAIPAVVLLTALFIITRKLATDRMEVDLVADHVRSLQVSHLVDVPSSDLHTVKPWFQGKLDFSPRVPDLAASGFPLVGGRLDMIGRRPAAALVYRRAKHLINVFVAHKIDIDSGSGAVDGYNLVKWTSRGLDYWAVSDVNPADLNEFAQLFQTSTSPNAPPTRER